MTPCLFLGSPLIPYLYIVNKMHYPEKARVKKLGGRVILALKINRKGELWSMYLYKKLDPVLDSEVMRVARSFPDNWQWLPATRNGTKIDGEYLISIEFDPEDL
jgi:TonB family protein